MLDIKPPEFKFCPFCGKDLQIKLEEGKERKFCPDDKWTYYPHVGAAAGGVAIKDGKVLMVKRGREPFKGKWMFPAGFIDYGEHPLEAVKREFKEETGLLVTSGKLLDVVQVDDDPRESGHYNFFYLVEFEDRGEVHTDEEENEEIAWLDLNSEIDMSFNGHKKILEMIRSKDY